MSLSDILGAAASGLSASQAGLGAVSNNIANANTPGYARQRVDPLTNVGLGRMSGVKTTEPSRIADTYLEGAVYRRGGDAGRADALYQFLDRVQAYLGSPGGSSDDTTSFGLPTQLNDLIAKATKMTGSQDPHQYSNAFLQSAGEFLGGVGRLANDITSLRTDVASDVGDTVLRVNTLLRQIHVYNDDISRLQLSGRSVSGLADQRLTALQELSGLVDVHTINQPDGKVLIETSSGQRLLDSRLRQLDYPNAGSSDAALSAYPAITLRFATDTGDMGASTGETVPGAAVGGKLGGLLQLRDAVLPGYTNQIARLAGETARSLNTASNASTASPAPASLTGRPSGLVAGDRLGFTGAAVVAVTASDGKIIARTKVDLSACATVQDAVDAINAGLSPNGSASLAADGTLTLKAAGSGAGIVVAQDPTTPSDRAGVGFSQFFGLNDVIRADHNPLVPPGFIGSDATGFAPGQTAHIVLRDPAGRELAGYTINGANGQTFQNVIDDLNAHLSGFGSFALDASGRIAFTATTAAAGVSALVTADSTDRSGTGVTFTALSGLPGAAASATNAVLHAVVAVDASRLPTGTFDTSAAVGEKGIGAGDCSGAPRYVAALTEAQDRGAGGSVTISNLAADVFSRMGIDAAQAKATTADATARRDEAIHRRDTFAGVNIDEELANMVVLQNSYSAAARVLTTASDMYQTLIDMMR
ncbi:FlgK family flagellar hook-associated protein [Sphingomonas sp. RIT328]|uniref:FlgK family flagellar hook-associated protein n=1 Tax=Sphingomonas sp. RIT328 TaxID=1470591 RepID=UPI00044BE9F1|nr:flagellar basal body rod C-terminal domain-containing protein [Sphingomonas sp. RIT328]EZP48684.1 Flagellar hook-associated protein FlgK [Sphingomonas sp. RIT328]